MTAHTPTKGHHISKAARIRNAAPELLAALEALTVELDHCPLDDKLIVLYGQANAAIRKAKG